MGPHIGMLNPLATGGADINKIKDSLKVQEEKMRKKLSQKLINEIKSEVEKKFNMAKNFRFLGINNSRDNIFGTCD